MYFGKDEKSCGLACQYMKFFVKHCFSKLLSQNTRYMKFLGLGLNEHLCNRTNSEGLYAQR